jgi:hypothetical protein
LAVKPETRIVQLIKNYLKAAWQGDCYHVHGSMLQRKGEPDLDGSICIGIKWVHLKIEVKTPDGEPSELQKHRLREYGKRGYMTGVVTSVEDVERLIIAYTQYLSEGFHLFGYYAKLHGIEDKYEIWA